VKYCLEHNEAIRFVHIICFRNKHSHFREPICPCFHCRCFRSYFLLIFRTVWSYTFTPPYIFISWCFDTETTLPFLLLPTAFVTLWGHVHLLVVICTTFLSRSSISSVLQTLLFSGNVLFSLLVLDLSGRHSRLISEPGSHSRLA
jgi:hypothetical protein